MEFATKKIFSIKHTTTTKFPYQKEHN